MEAANSPVMTQSVSTSGIGSLLILNGGSSTLKFALFQIGNHQARSVSGSFDRIGSPNSTLTWRTGTDPAEHRTVDARDHVACIEPLMIVMKDLLVQHPLRAIGHRVVHGGRQYHEPQRVTSVVLEELQRLSAYDPEHLPAEIQLIRELARRHPHLPQVACFDTAFHHGMPTVARLIPIPRRYYSAGVQRYGFHGLSYAYLMKELARTGEPGEADGRIILAHLGNGASMAAVKSGQAVDTTMGFTPVSGLPMSRRSGDLDPGLVSYFVRTEGMTVERFHQMVHTESGLLGVSETSSDMRDLLDQEHHDLRAAEAVELFCYQAKKSIGALCAALGGVDTLVFSGGIGEHAPSIRARICAGLECFGIAISESANLANQPIISTEAGRVNVRVIPTDEECEIAESVAGLLNEKPYIARNHEGKKYHTVE